MLNSKPSFLRNNMTNYVLDSCIIIALLYKENGFEKVIELLSEKNLNDSEIYMSTVNFGEVSWFLYKNSPLKAEFLLQAVKDLKINFVSPDIDDSESAGFYKSQGGVAYPDCFVLSLAKKLQAKIVTKDKEFKKFETKFEIVWLD